MTGPLWSDLQVFLAVLDGGSLSGAARRLGLAQPTTRVRINALERALGTVLFTRSASGLLPTDQARALEVHVQSMALAADAVVRAASGVPGKISGTVRLSVPEMVAIAILPPMLVRLRLQHPGLVIEVVPSNLIADLPAQEADIAVRMQRPHGANLVARHVGTILLGLFAHRDYVARKGVPTDVGDLVHHDIVGPDRSAYDLAFAQSVNPALDRDAFVIRIDSHIGQLAAVRAGAGIGFVQRRLGDNDPDLIAVLPRVDVGALDTWLVVHEDLRRLPKVRATFDHLAHEFGHYQSGVP